VSWAGGGQNEAAKEPGCFGTVAADFADLRVSSQECGEVVGNDGGAENVFVHAAGALGLGANVPERDAIFEKFFCALRITQLWRRANQSAHDFPKGILRKGVILAAFERDPAGQGTENQDVGAGVGDGREAARAFGFCRAGCWRHTRSFYAGRRYWGCSGAPFLRSFGAAKKRDAGMGICGLAGQRRGVFEDLAVGEIA